VPNALTCPGTYQPGWAADNGLAMILQPQGLSILELCDPARHLLLVTTRVPCRLTGPSHDW